MNVFKPKTQDDAIRQEIANAEMDKMTNFIIITHAVQFGPSASLLVSEQMGSFPQR